MKMRFCHRLDASADSAGKVAVHTRRRRLTLVCIAVFACVCVIWYLSAHGWVKRGMASGITVAGVTVQGASLYASSDGRLLVTLPSRNFVDMYLLYPLMQKAGSPSVCNAADSGEFIFMNNLALSEDATDSVPCETMPGLEDVIPPRLDVNGNTMSFYDTDDRCVAIHQ